ncbi:MAG: cellulase family glycosylhydrolase [Pirellulales bacterium]
MLQCTTMMLFILPFLFIGTSSALPASVVEVEVDAASVVYTMRGGIGASWHAIEKPIPGAHGGSAWGGNPPAEDEAAWQQVYRHADWLGLDWCRVELEQRMYEPQRRQFDWDNPEMGILYRILDFCQRRKVDVFLQQMWGNVAWNTFPQWRDDPVRRVHSGPVSMADYANGLATLVEHLVKRKGYSCIRWLSIVNEPGPSWAWWQKPPNESLPLPPGLAAVRKALDDRGIALPLSGPDWSNHPALVPEKIDFDQFIGAYDIHSYFANFDGREGGFSLSVAEQRLADWANWAHARGKPFFLSEVGTMVFGWQGSSPGPGTYQAALKDVELVIRGLAVGVDAFNRWSFVNRGDLDGQWQLIDTWDTHRKELLNVFTPHPNSYYLFGLVPRFTAKHSAVLKCKVAGGTAGELRHVFAAALRSPQGNLTLLIVNDAQSAWDLAIDLHGLSRETRLYRYRITPAQRDRADLKIQPGKEFVLGTEAARLLDRIPASSLSVYTTYKRGHDESGIIAE